MARKQVDSTTKKNTAMSEITLTGGTLVPKAHNHGKDCCHNHHKSGIEMKSLDHNARAAPLDLDTATEVEIARILFTLMRFGRYEALQRVLQELDEKGKSLFEILKEYDEGGHTLIHWASKRVDDIRFLQKFLDLAAQHSLQELMNVSSKDNVGMGPIHWACTEGSIRHVALLLQSGANIEAKDNSGCTPLLIASQYGQVNVVAYLLKKGANLKAVDSSLDTALHWAAYKGSNEVCGLLAYYYQDMSFTTQDAYGQSPLHLAALRGNTSVVRYILQQLERGPKSEREVLFVKDKNQRTPLDLAIHKKRGNVEIVLREAMAAAEDPRGHMFRSTLGQICSLRSWKLWCGMVPMVDEMDTPSRFPFYFVLANFVLFFVLMVGVMAPFANAGSGLLWDVSQWLVADFATMLCVWYFYYKTVTTQPGFLDDSHPDIGKWRKLYEETLDLMADEGTTNTHSHEPPKPKFELCHTCHLARPHRSKHCRVTRKCVLLFDHFCPFVDNTVGLNNYSYFLFFVGFLVTNLFCYSITWITYARRYRIEHGSLPWWVMLFSLELTFIMIPVCGLFFYHVQLTATNLTTNEHMNMRRYKYLFPVIGGTRVFKNPWDKGYFGNFMDRMNPSNLCYEIPSDYESLLHKEVPASSSCCPHGKCDAV